LNLVGLATRDKPAYLWAVQKRPAPTRSASVIPRMTLVVLAGFALFIALTLLYALPVLLESPPPGAVPDYLAERVKAHLQGKVTWLMAAAFTIVGVLGAWRAKR
jgi:succinate dehydrogenase/fumarate reductase cytochrome b subunit